MRAALIYPHQLFPEHPALSGADVCVLVEEPLLLTQYRFHRQKLILHRASMQHFADRLRRQKRQVRYVECGELDSTGDIAGVLTHLGVKHVQFVDPCDDWLQQRLAFPPVGRKDRLEAYPTQSGNLQGLTCRPGARP